MQNIVSISEENAKLIDLATRELQRINSEPLQTVIAAARTKSGKEVTAVNLYHFTGGPCAEAVLIANNLYTGDSFEQIVAVHFDDNHTVEVINPCGRCRQMFNDYLPDVSVLTDDGGNVTEKSVDELLPYAYRNNAVEYVRSTRAKEAI